MKKDEKNLIEFDNNLNERTIEEISNSDRCVVEVQMTITTIIFLLLRYWQLNGNSEIRIPIDETNNKNDMNSDYITLSISTLNIKNEPMIYDYDLDSDMELLFKYTIGDFFDGKFDLEYGKIDQITETFEDALNNFAIGILSDDLENIEFNPVIAYIPKNIENAFLELKITHCIKRLKNALSIFKLGKINI
jgi:hypothetical protein